MDRQNELVTGLPRYLDAWEQTRVMVMKQLGSFALISFQVISYFGLPCFSDFISVFQVSVYAKKTEFEINTSFFTMEKIMPILQRI